MKTEDYLKLEPTEFQNATLSLEFPETSMFYIHHLKGFWDTIYLSRKINLHKSKQYSQEHLHVQVYMQS